MKIKIETERLYLRELTESDFDSLYNVLADSDIMKHYPYTFDDKRVKFGLRKILKDITFSGSGCGRSS